ncbi:MAG: hypothetical protein ACHQC8_05850 [Solirubrobacterales bacterium]
MSSRENYAPGAAAGAEVRKEREKWTLVLGVEAAPAPSVVAGAILALSYFFNWKRA